MRRCLRTCCEGLIFHSTATHGTQPREQRCGLGCSEARSRKIIEENILQPSTEEGKRAAWKRGEGLLTLREGLGAGGVAPPTMPLEAFRAGWGGWREMPCPGPFTMWPFPRTSIPHAARALAFQVFPLRARKWPHDVMIKSCLLGMGRNWGWGGRVAKEPQAALQ